MADPYELNRYDCGCRIVSEFRGGLGCKTIEYCPTHKAAPRMAELLSYWKPPHYKEKGNCVKGACVACEIESMARDSFIAMLPKGEHHAR